MKKALVLAFTLVLGLGLFASAQTWEGVWDTDISIDPSTTVFADFLSFDSDLDIDFAIAGWVFSMTSDFSGIGLDGLGFDAVGVIGAFSFDVDMDFAPMKLTTLETAYTGLAVLRGVDSPCLQTPSWTYTTKTVTKTYIPAFDDLTAEMSVSIAGLNLGVLFFLEGADSDLATSYSNYQTDTGFPGQVANPGIDIPVLTPPLLDVASSVKTGTGAKLTISGSFAGATFTNYTYFNLVEYSDHAVSLYDVDYLATILQMSGTIKGLECPGCNVMFTRNYTLIEGLAPFGDCLMMDIAIDFSCCDFEGIGILIHDVSLGCCWDLRFDFLIEFDTDSKTMTLEPEMTFASSCFTIVAAVAWDDAHTINGINFQGLSYSHAFNGVTVSFAATWDYIANPLVGSYGYIQHNYADVLHFWKPDVRGSDNAVVVPANPPAIVLATGVGDWVMVDIVCSYDRAYVFNQMSISYEADACCAGALSFDVDTYFGEITNYDLVGVYGTYYWDTDNSGTYDAGEFVEFLGADYGYAEYVALLAGRAEPLATNTVPGVDACDVCQVDDTIAESSLLVGEYGAGTVIPSILGWVETDAEVTLGLGSNVAFTLGIDVSWFGWGSLTFGVEFTF